MSFSIHFACNLFPRCVSFTRGSSNDRYRLCVCVAIKFISFIIVLFDFGLSRWHNHRIPGAWEEALVQVLEGFLNMVARSSGEGLYSLVLLA